MSEIKTKLEARWKAAGVSTLVAWGMVLQGCSTPQPHFELAREPVLITPEASPAEPFFEPRIPPRPAEAMGGTAFLEAVKDLEPAEREQAIAGELSKGNLPDFLRRLIPVRVFGPDGTENAIVVHAMPDYLAIGSDADYVRIPMNFYTAAALAREWGFVLPTSRIVDAIFAQAAIRLEPSFLPPTRAMSTVPYFLDHELRIREQLAEVAPGQLIAGHKKDIVLSTRLEQRPYRIAIYGWHNANGLPIQPVSTAHGARYVDYSHGVRFISGAVWFRGERRSFYDALADLDAAPCLSNEGPFEHARGLMAPRERPNFEESR